MVGSDELIGKKSSNSEIGHDNNSKTEELSGYVEKDHCLECANSHRKSNGQNAIKGSKQVIDLDNVDIIKGMIVELFVDQVGEAYAAVKINNYIEPVPINSTRFKDWIIKTHYDYEKAVAGSKK